MSTTIEKLAIVKEWALLPLYFTRPSKMRRTPSIVLYTSWNVFSGISVFAKIFQSFKLL
jgi:hypothetical protein